MLIASLNKSGINRVVRVEITIATEARIALPLNFFKIACKTAYNFLVIDLTEDNVIVKVAAMH